MTILNSYDLSQIDFLARRYFLDTAGNDYGTDEVGQISVAADSRLLAHTLTTHAGAIGTTTSYISDPGLTFARWAEIKTAFGEALMAILNQSENTARKMEIAAANKIEVANLTANNITACIQASEHGILDRADSAVLFALWNHDINSDFVLSDVHVDRADAMLAGATTLFDWSEDSSQMIAGKIVLAGVLMAGMAWGSPAVAYGASAVLTATSVLLLGHGVYTGLQAINAEQQATDSVTEYLAMRGQGQAAAEIGMAALGAYGGYRGMVKARTPETFAPRPSFTPTEPVILEQAGLVVKNPPAASVPTFALYITHWLSKAKNLPPLEAYIDPRTGFLMVLKVGQSFMAEYVVASTELATELLTALRTRQLTVPTAIKPVSLWELETALCKILDQPAPAAPVGVSAPSVPAPIAAASGY